MTTNCNCCNGLLLRHIRHGQVVWFCRTCWQDMPDLETVMHLRHKPMAKRLKNSLKVLRHQSAIKLKATTIKQQGHLPA